MKKFFKLGLAMFGFALAFVAFANHATAKVSDSNKVVNVSTSFAGCVGKGNCGTTINGTQLNGSWRESERETEAR